MKVTTVKFDHAVRFEGSEVSFLDVDKHKVELDYDPKTMVLSIMSGKDFVQTNLTNCIWWKPAREPKAV